MKRQHITSVLTLSWPKSVSFQMATPLISWMMFSASHIMLVISDTFKSFILMFLEIIVSSIPAFTGQINKGNFAFWLKIRMLARVIQEEIKKLALHWMLTSNLLRVYSWCWTHLIDCVFFVSFISLFNDVISHLLDVK